MKPPVQGTGTVTWQPAQSWTQSSVKGLRVPVGPHEHSRDAAGLGMSRPGTGAGRKGRGAGHSPTGGCPAMARADEQGPLPPAATPPAAVPRLNPLQHWDLQTVRAGTDIANPSETGHNTIVCKSSKRTNENKYMCALVISAPFLWVKQMH